MRAFVVMLYILAIPGDLFGQSANNFRNGIGYYALVGDDYIPLGAPYALRRLDTIRPLHLEADLKFNTGNMVMAIRNADNVRIFSYGIDISRSIGLAPPQRFFSACLFRPNQDDGKGVEGPYGVGVKRVGDALAGELPIYEILIPPVVHKPYFSDHDLIYWSFSYDADQLCRTGWLFSDTPTVTDPASDVGTTSLPEVIECTTPTGIISTSRQGCLKLRGVPQ